MVELVEYLDDRKRSPFADWRKTLDPTTRGRIEISLARLRGGNTSAAKSVGSGVSELRLDFGPGYRIYFARHGDTYIVLLGGGSKGRQQIDIEEAKLRWAEYKRRKLNKR